MGGGWSPPSRLPHAYVSWLSRAESWVGSQGSSLRDALHSAFRMLLRQGRLQPGRPRPGHPLPGHHLPGQPPRHPLRRECTSLERHQWGPCPSGHLLSGHRQPPGPPGRVQVRGTLQGRQEEWEADDGRGGNLRIGTLCSPPPPWIVTCGKQRQAVGGLGRWGQKGAITCKPKRVENWGQWGRGEESSYNFGGCGSEHIVLERELWLEPFPGVCWEAGICLGAGS